MMFGELLNRILGRSTESAFQNRVDQIARADMRKREERRSESSFGEGVWSTPSPSPTPEPVASPPGGIFGTLLAGLTGMQGLSELAEQFQAGRPWLAQLNRLSQELPGDARLLAVQRAIGNLPEHTRRDLAARLSSTYGSGSGDLSEIVAGYLQHPDGFERLLLFLVPAQPAVGESSSPNLMAAMKDPVARDLLRGLSTELAHARDSAAEAITEF